MHIHIKLPVKLTEEQREVLEEYARLETDTPGKPCNYLTVFLYGEAHKTEELDYLES